MIFTCFTNVPQMLNSRRHAESNYVHSPLELLNEITLHDSSILCECTTSESISLELFTVTKQVNRFSTMAQVYSTTVIQKELNFSSMTRSFFNYHLAAPTYAWESPQNQPRSRAYQAIRLGWSRRRRRNDDSSIFIVYNSMDVPCSQLSAAIA